MLTRVVASNFKSLGEDVELPLGRLVALVGINGAGKSNLLQVPRFVARALSDGLDSAIRAENGFEGIARVDDVDALPVWIRVEVAGPAGAGEYEIHLRADLSDGYYVESEHARWTGVGQASAEFRVAAARFLGPDGLAPSLDATGLALPLVAADDRFAPLYDELRSVGLYTLLPRELRASVSSSRALVTMRDDGTDWAAHLSRVLHAGERGADLIAALNALLPEIVDARAERFGGGLYSVGFLHEVARQSSPHWLDVFSESDGTLRIAGLLTALLQESAPNLIGIEEPELYVHPGALAIVHDHLREASERSQVIFTTHSPDLLDLLPAEAIRIVDRQAGTTRVSTMSPDQQQLVRAHLSSPGELLRIEGLHAA